jgi:hypothetical protein
MQFLKDFATYMLSPGPNSDTLHNPITSWFWWCWNANSFDTGGLVHNMQLHFPGRVVIVRLLCGLPASNADMQLANLYS